MFVCENCIVYIDESTEHGWFVGSPEAVWSDAPIIEMGIDLSAAKWDPIGTMSRWQGSTKAFSYRGTSFLINSTFGY
jgi:hypothetical protein